MSDKRQNDIAMLKEALALEKLRDTDREAFEDMLAELEAGQRWMLSQKQRDWVTKVLDKPTYENLVSSGKVPRGREVPTPVVLQTRPLKPPGAT